MQRRTKWTIGAGVAAAALIGSAGTALAAGGDSDGDETEAPITGVALEQASEAALAHTGGGEVTETEIEDEEGYYEIEVTLDDGAQVDVHLDEEFNVLGAEADDAGDD